MKQHTLPTPFALNRIGRAALIALPVLVARADAAPKTHASVTKTSVRSPKKADVKVLAVSGEAARGAVFNRDPGQSVELSLTGAAKVSVAEGADVVRTKVLDGMLSIEAVKAGRAVVVVQRDGMAAETYIVRVRDTSAAAPAVAPGNSSEAAPAAPAVQPVSTPVMRVVTAVAAQTADLTVPAGAVVVPSGNTGPVSTTSGTRGTPVTVTPATASSAQTSTGATDITVATRSTATGTNSTTGLSPITRSVSTPTPVTSGELTTGTSRQLDTGRVSGSVAAPRRMPTGTAMYPTTPNIPERVRTATKTAPRNSIQVTQGLARLLQFRKNILSVFFSDVNVMDARAVNARTVAITGLVPGTSTLAVFSERFPGDAIGQPVIYQISVRAPAGPTIVPAPAPSIESIETAIRTAIDDPRVNVSVIQSPGGTLTARLTGSVRDVAEIEAIKSTALLFVPQVVSAIYADPLQQSLTQVRQPSDSAQLQDMLRHVTDNPSIELIDAPGGGSILKASVASMEEANNLMRLVPLQQRVTPFIVVRGATGAGSQMYNQGRPSLTGEDVEMTERLQAITGVRTVYASRTAENGLAVYGTVLNRSEYDTVRRFARILPVRKTGQGDREDNIPANFPASADTYPLGVQMFVTILDASQAVLRKVTVNTNVVEINRTALRNLGIEYGSASVLNQTAPTTQTVNGVTTITPGTITVDPNITVGSTLLGNGLLGTGGFSNLNPVRAQLNALYRNGNARILSSPNVSALNGMDAQITVGGSRPIPTAAASQGAVGTGIEFRRYGIILTMRPTVTDDDTIILQIRADVTNIDPTTAVTIGNSVIPGETTRSVNTTINVREGDVIVMGGLITNEQLRRTSRVPFLSQIPFLGSLFQSKRFENNETELAIFMSPTITRTLASPDTDVTAFYAASMRPLPGNGDGASTATVVNPVGGR